MRVFNHDTSVGQAERGETFYIFNVVQPTMLGSIFSNAIPSIALRNTREFYLVNNVEASDGGQIEVTYFATGSEGVEALGSLTTNITVFGKYVLH